ncbi:acyl-CoA dehydrogenase family protein [Gelidibacter pelagius]|uniref:Acyl-CoA dehydrogenase family protein n=1 Tax=Gelidibacter pelagius TaxID=2819985 RepID=A0ABS3SQU5_9FLAO|nr:acyl-CoA dehydrogenase family protein [Gelidibacter pelagius]MBO3098014.1 acyl-CoA dehydrogenase family protein [Gelidibacter pelagius]
MSNYHFTEEHLMFQESLKAFMKKEVIPNIDTWEEEQRIPTEVWKKMGDLGFLGLGFPEEFGGSDLDFFYDVIFVEELAKVFSGGFAITQAVVQYMSSPYILKHGSQQLKEKYLPKLISGDAISGIAITEPSAGSDVANIQTTATLEGDHYILNGSKTFITNAVYGDFVICVVKTDVSAGPGGVSLLVVDLDADGIQKTKLKKLGWHASDTAELSFDNVKVPKENLIGQEGQGFYYLMGGLQLERLVGAIMGYAASESALEYTLQYMSERTAFNRPINKFQVLRHRMAQLASEIEACKQFVLHCSRLHNDGKYAVKESSMAKLLATELSDKTMTQCLQSFGGYGYMEEYKIARMFRDSRIGTIGGGTSEIMREIIAKMVIDDVSYEKSTETKNEINTNINLKTDQKMSTQLETLLDVIKAKTAKVDPIGHTLKFDFGEEQLYIDGKGDVNQVSTSNDPAECVIETSFEDFIALTKGELNPMAAVMGGKVKIKGDMSVAMKLQTIFG